MYRFAKVSHFISEQNPEPKNSIKGKTYSLYCNGAVGDMLYLTDLDYTEQAGHNIAEVEIYGTGIFQFCSNQFFYLIFKLSYSVGFNIKQVYFLNNMGKKNRQKVIDFQNRRQATDGLKKPRILAR